MEIIGDPVAGTYHAVRAIDAGRHGVMVDVEADWMVGPLLAERARKAGVVYSRAYGDQPTLICELVRQDEGLFFLPCGVDDLTTVFRAAEIGGQLARRGTVEIASSLRRDGAEVARDLRWGVYVTFEACTDYAVQCFAEYGVRTDETGR